LIVSAANLELRSACIEPESPIAEFREQAATARLAPYFRWKPILDGVLAVALLAPGLPLLLFLVILVRVTSPGPAIFKQRRVGQGGRIFTMYKLRSMRQDAERRVGAVWASAADPRVTPVGRLLRKLHLDELPQLFNVLKGEMSLIGPRPERPEFVAVLKEQIPGYCDRLAVLPGVTGLAQINLPPDQTLDDVRRKLVLDREYIACAGLVLDLAMLFCTFLRMIGVPGDLATRVSCIARRVELPVEENAFVALGGDGAETTPGGLAAAFHRKISEHDANHGNANGNGHANGNGKNGAGGHAPEALRRSLADAIKPQ
jgi:lipopolysaccharide/colanic/teichoic acid biosynthesis glycosyltransferase